MTTKTLSKAIVKALENTDDPIAYHGEKTEYITVYRLDWNTHIEDWVQIRIDKTAIRLEHVHHAIGLNINEGVPAAGHFIDVLTLASDSTRTGGLPAYVAELVTCVLNGNSWKRDFQSECYRKPFTTFIDASTGEPVEYSNVPGCETVNAVE